MKENLYLIARNELLLKEIEDLKDYNEKLNNQNERLRKLLDPTDYGELDKDDTK